MPSVSSTTTPPDAPEIAPSPASSSTPSPSSSSPAPAPQPSHLSAYARRAWRATRTWLAPAPAATTCAAPCACAPSSRRVNRLYRRRLAPEFPSGHNCFNTC